MAPGRLLFPSFLLLAASVFGQTPALAGIQPIALFSGDKVETFEPWTEQPYFELAGLFQGMGTATPLIENNLYVSYRWFNTSFASPQSGGRLAGLGHGGFRLDFTAPVYVFGGYFASVSNYEGGTIRFFNDSGELGQASVSMPIGAAMTWNGWQSSQGFTALEITSNFQGGPNSGGWFAMDTLQLATSPVPEPSPQLMLLVGLALVWSAWVLRSRVGE